MNIKKSYRFPIALHFRRNTTQLYFDRFTTKKIATKALPRLQEELVTTNKPSVIERRNGKSISSGLVNVLSTNIQGRLEL